VVSLLPLRLFLSLKISNICVDVFRRGCWLGLQPIQLPLRTTKHKRSSGQRQQAPVCQVKLAHRLNGGRTCLSDTGEHSGTSTDFLQASRHRLRDSASRRTTITSQNYIKSTLQEQSSHHSHPLSSQRIVQHLEYNRVSQSIQPGKAKPSRVPAIQGEMNSTRKHFRTIITTGSKQSNTIDESCLELDSHQDMACPFNTLIRIRWRLWITPVHTQASTMTRTSVQWAQWCWQQIQV